MEMENRTNYAAAADAQAFFATMAGLRGDRAAEKAHWDLALIYQCDHIKQGRGQ
jgi:hypothetical protein